MLFAWCAQASEQVAPATVAAPPEEPASPSDHPQPWLSFEGRLAALLCVGLDAHDVRPGGLIAGELDFARHWGVGLEFDQLVDQTKPDPDYSGGSLVVGRHAVTLYAGYRFIPSPSMALDLFGGVRTQHVIVDTQGYPAAGHHEVFPIGPWISALYELRVAGPLLVFGQVQFDTAFSTTSFLVSDPPYATTVYVLPSSNLEIAIGIALRTD
jgi:hypothetical protein